MESGRNERVGSGRGRDQTSLSKERSCTILSLVQRENEFWELTEVYREFISDSGGVRLETSVPVDTRVTR